MVVVEPPGERFDQRGVVGFHPAAGQASQCLRVALAGDQGLNHVAGGHGVQGAGDGRDLDLGVFE
jgi:hypothetical protein